MTVRKYIGGVPAVLVFIVAVGFVLRLASVPLVHRGGYMSDEKDYIHLGKQIAAGESFVDLNGERSVRSPLFPLLLGGLFSVFGDNLMMAHVFGCLLGALAVFLSYFVSVAVFHDVGAGLAASALLAVYPGLVIYSALLETESLYIVFFLATLIVAHRFVGHPSVLSAVTLGILGGFAALTRVVFLGFFPVLLLGLLRAGSDRMRRLVPVLFSVLAFTVVILPWTIRNYEVHGTLIPISTGGGRSFLAGNNPFATGTWRLLPGFEEWRNQELHNRGLAGSDSLTEEELNSASFDIGIDYMREHPGQTVALAFRKVYIFWFFPITNSDSDYTLQAVAVLADFILLCGAVVGYVATREKGVVMFPLIAALLVFTVIHAVLHSEVRFRLPLVPIVGVFAGAGVGWVRHPEMFRGLIRATVPRRILIALLGVIVGVYLFTAFQFLEGRV